MTEGNFEAHPANSSQIVRFKPKKESSLAYFQEEKKPKLYFYVNPSSITHAYKKKINRQKSRAGWIDEYWGDELDTLSIEALSGGMRIADGGYTSLSETHAKGDNNALRRLEEIVQLYRRNGLSFSGDFPSDFSPLEFGFDRFVYYGYFESFSLENNTERPFMMGFNFTLKVLGTDVLF